MSFPHTTDNGDLAAALADAIAGSNTTAGRVTRRPSGRRLAAADRRATAAQRVCADCGAQCQQGLAVHGQRPRCVACNHIALLVAEQIKLANVARC
ncbi:hypothetical protein ACQP2T_30485 [Nonomuraea sp. CA-143628]|uniref:hypothetical protein n=1 Tax=Nonomuraea sp. CA-143628 TaxID=3239997 RepID=UPI003D8E74C9